MRRTLRRVGAVVGIAGLTGGAWLAGRQVRSPAEAAASAKAPTASRITAAVEERALESTVIVRGLVRYGDPRAVVLAPSSLKSGAAAGAAIVSVPAEKGAALGEGAVALAVGGRPVFVLGGALPAYRDLRPGDKGSDVRQLEAALQRLGHQPGAVDGVYDAATERAVEAWYAAAGYSAFGPTEAQRTQLKSSRTAVTQADDAVLAAQRSVDSIRNGTVGDKRLSAEEQLASGKERAATAASEAELSQRRAEAEVQARRDAADLAVRQVELAEAALARSRRDAGDTATVTDANDALETARSSARSAAAAVADAQAQVPLSDAALVDARANLDQARKDLDTTKKSPPSSIAPGGVIMTSDNSEAIARAEAGVRQAEASVRQAEANVNAASRSVDARRSAVTDAERAVARAEAAIGRAERSVGDRSSAVAEAEQRLASAVNDQKRAARDLDTSIASQEQSARTSAAAVRQAQAAVRIAAAQLAALRAPTDLMSAQKQLGNAEASRSRAKADLVELESQIGVVVPANEVLFFNSLPLRVDDVKALRGDVVNGAVMTVTTARLAVDSSVDTSDARLVRGGAKVRIESSEFDVAMDGTVTEIASTAGTKGVDPGKVYLEVTPVADAVSSSSGSAVDPTQLNGTSVKLTIPIQSTGKAVLAVPVAGVSVSADGSSRVEIEDAPDRPTRFVRVRTGISAEGYVAVTPIDGELAAGDLVVVGNRDGSAIAGAVEANDEPGGAAASDPPATDAASTEASSDASSSADSSANTSEA